MSVLEHSFIRDLTPGDLGLDAARFVEFRGVQYEALEWAIEALTDRGKRFAGLALPTGAGKSLFAAALIRLLGSRAVVLTATKALQEQYAESFVSAGMVDIRGKANYDCADIANLNCKDGARAGCRFVKGSSAAGCTYDVKKLCARNAAAVVSNYDFWMSVNAVRNSSGLERTAKEASWKGDNPVELLVLDEAHEAAEKLSSFVSATIYESELLKRWKSGWPRSEEVWEWVMFAADILPLLEDELVSLEMKGVAAGKLRDKKFLEEVHRLEGLIAKFQKLAAADKEDWICEQEVGGRYGRSWRFDPVWPGRYAEEYLFCRIPKIVLMSATLKPKTFAMLGVKKEGFEFRAWRRIFPAHRQPIYQLSVKNDEGKLIRLRNNSPRSDYQRLIEFADREIIAPRLDRKGLIQTVSYERAELVQELSAHRQLMIGNDGEPDSETAWEVAEKFRKAAPPKILVSPSFSTGWDFPMDELEYIVLLKVPWKNWTAKVMRARIERDKDYNAHQAMQATEQGIGRGFRKEVDQCEVFLLDGGYVYFLRAYKHLAQDWFVSAVRKVDRVPAPLPKLAVQK